MSRKSKIIVCISGIVVITLALLGFTFGFFLTQIQGNESSKSIEVVTGDAKIKYTDLSESDIDEIIEPGYEVVKPFTIENIGEGRATYSIYLVDVVNNFNRTQDLTYTLYRTNGIITDTIDKDTDFSKWDTLKENIVYPTTSGSIQSNEIVEDSASYTYALKITYINHPTESQNIDQGKVFQGSINIRATASETNPFAEGTLAYNIIANATSKETVSYNKTVYIEPSLQDGTNYTMPAEQVSGETERIISYSFDDYGTSYYYRGGVQDNYVLFNDMCWRTVRIQGDGSIKLLYEGRTLGAKNCSSVLNKILSSTTYGYKKITGLNGKTWYLADYEKDGTTNENISGNSDISLKEEIDEWFNKFFMANNELTDNGKKIKEDIWCLGGSDDFRYNSDTGLLLTNTDYSNMESGTYKWNYSFGKRMLKTKQVNLMCDETEQKIKSRVGSLTADEVILAGGNDTPNYSYYLYNEDISHFWTLSRSLFNSNRDYVSFVDYNGKIIIDGGSGDSSVFGKISVRPVISLKSGIGITGGVGTIDDPYVIG